MPSVQLWIYCCLARSGQIRERANRLGGVSIGVARRGVFVLGGMKGTNSDGLGRARQNREAI